jgi:hypothetical protein
MSDPSEQKGRDGESRAEEVAAKSPTSPARPAKEQDRAQAHRESQASTVSEPGGFTNDPDDSTNPNEAIERHRRRLRPRTPG